MYLLLKSFTKFEGFVQYDWKVSSALLYWFITFWHQMIRFSFPIKLWSSKHTKTEIVPCSYNLQEQERIVKIIFNLFSRHVLASMRVQVKTVQNTYILMCIRVIIVKTIWKLKYGIYLFNLNWIWNRSTLHFESNARPEKVCLYEVVLGMVKYRGINEVSYLFYFYFEFEFYSESNSISQGSKLRLTFDL